MNVHVNVNVNKDKQKFKIYVSPVIIMNQLPYNDDVHAGNVNGQSPPYIIL